RFTCQPPHRAAPHSYSVRAGRLGQPRVMPYLPRSATRVSSTPRKPRRAHRRLRTKVALAAVLSGCSLDGLGKPSFTPTLP
ncbi:MAG: hypothetical protein ACYDB7_11865, partial [Mycobacteriales bacterium]